MVPDTCTVLKLVVFSSESRAPLARCLAVDPRSLDHLASTAVALMPWEMYCKMTASTSNRLPTASASRSGVGFPHVRLPSGEAIALTTGTRQAAGNGIVTLQSPKMPPLEALKPCHIGLRRVVRAAGNWCRSRHPCCFTGDFTRSIKYGYGSHRVLDLTASLCLAPFCASRRFCGPGAHLPGELFDRSSEQRLILIIRPVLL